MAGAYKREAMRGFLKREKYMKLQNKDHFHGSDLEKIEEIMIKDRTADAIDVSLLVYTYTEKGMKSIFNGSYGHPYHNYLCKGNRYILKVFAHMREASWSKYTYKNGVISEQVVFSEELNESQEDYTQPSESEVNTFKLTDRAPINNIRINK
mgnify:CR=1 FL=1